MGDLLSVEDLKTHFFTERGIVRAVDGVSFTVKEGESVALVGESGSGKTVTALSILRLLSKGTGKTVGGSVMFQGTDLLGLSEAEMREFRGKRISMVLQDPYSALNPVLTIGRQVSEAITVHQKLTPQRLFERVLEMLRMVRIPSPELQVRAYPHMLSGGMRQRVVGAIALSCQPHLLICDEPTTALDATVQAQYLQLLENLRREAAVSILFITHDFGIVARMCDRVVVMYAGHIMESAEVREIFNHPANPYTVGLINAIPRMQSVERLFSIEGQPPSLLNPPPGCLFAPRCWKATGRCTEERPPLTEVGRDHYVSCWHSGEVRAGRSQERGPTSAPT